MEPSRLGVGVLERDMVGSGGWNSLLEKGSWINEGEALSAWDRALLAAALVSTFGDFGAGGLAGCPSPSAFAVVRTAPDVVLLCAQPMVD